MHGTRSNGEAERYGATANRRKVLTPEYRELRIECSRKYLEEVRDLAVRHRANEAFINSLYEDAAGIAGIDYRRELVDMPRDVDRVPNSVANLIDMKRRAEADAAAYTERKSEARDLLNAMDGTYGRLLLLRYCTVLPWVRVAEVLNYDETYCRSMRNDALDAFYDYLPIAYRVPGHSAV